MSWRATLAGLLATWGGQSVRVRDAYSHAFRGDRYVLRDLAAYCQVGVEVPNDDLQRAEGKRAVFWHIANMLRVPVLEIEKHLNEEGTSIDVDERSR